MSSAIVPPGYTFLNPQVLITEKGLSVVTELLDEARNKYPNAFDLYVYSDFYNHAVLGLLDKTLLPLHDKIMEKQWDDAWILVESLIVFIDIENDWPMCDDSKRVSLTNKLFGAFLVTVIRALQNENRLDAAHLPNLDSLLKMVVDFGALLNGVSEQVCYDSVCKAIGSRLFVGKDDELKALHFQRREAWLDSLSVEEASAIREAIKEDYNVEDDDDEEEQEPAWYLGANAAHEFHVDDDFLVPYIWEEYKAHLVNAPTSPLKGPPDWDISKWSESDRQQYSMDRPISHRTY